MIVNFKKARALIVPIGKTGASYTIVPGINLVDDKTWEQMADTLKDRIGEGKDLTTIVKVTKGKDGKDVESSIAPKDLSADQAKQVIEKIMSRDVIKKWLDDESKESIRAMLFKRLDEIEKATASEE